ncbi:MAG: DNA-directed RNA polymerase subunit D [Halobacteria archaeon]
MELKFLEKKETEARFLLHGVPASFANALRRIMVGEVPKMAVAELNIYENNSALYDEMLGLRLALVPLKTPPDGFVLPAECSCGGQGCASCQVTLTLSADGPRTVLSRDLLSSDPRVAPADGNVPLIRLKQGQRVYLEAFARLGRGRDHAKWQPVVAAGYKEVPRVKVKGVSNWERVAASCPVKVFAEEPGKVRDEMACTFCGECMVVCEPKGSVQVTPERDAFLFTFETDGSLPAAEVLRRAVEILKSKAEGLKAAIGDKS